MAMRIVHCLTVKLRPVFRRTRTARRQRPMVPLAVVETMIDMSIEMSGTMEPRSRADKDSARKPLRTVVPVRRAVVRRHFVIPVRANRRSADRNRNLSRRTRTCGEKQAHNNRRQSYCFQSSHSFTSHLGRRAPPRDRFHRSASDCGFCRQLCLNSNSFSQAPTIMQAPEQTPLRGQTSRPVYLGWPCGASCPCESCMACPWNSAR